MATEPLLDWGSRRLGNFPPEDALPAALYKVRSTDYTVRGYDRGHIAPSADRTRKEADNSATFLMANMMLQVPEVNRGVWGDLEEYCRELVQQGKELDTSGRAGEKEEQHRLKQKISVLAKTWKVILVLDRHGLGVQGVTATLLALALMMPNDSSVKGKGWKSFV